MHNTQSDIEHLKKTLQLAENGAGRGDGGPFGAIIVKDGQIVSEAWNTVIADNDPTAHAEINAIRLASKTIGHFHLSGCTLYASSEPCPLCLSATYWAKIDRIVFANSKQEAARIGFSDQELYAELTLPLSQRTIPTHQIEIDHSKDVLDRWAVRKDKIVY